MCGSYSKQQMNMIGCPTDSFGHTSRGADRAAQKRMQTFAPVIGNERFAMLGGKNNVDMKTQMRGRHCLSSDPLGRADHITCDPGVALRLPPANIRRPFR